MNLAKAIIIVATLLSRSAAAQEFKVHDNGLNYSESTMSALEHIVDSMNINTECVTYGKPITQYHRL